MTTTTRKAKRQNGYHGAAINAGARVNGVVSTPRGTVAEAPRIEVACIAARAGPCVGPTSRFG
jgi:hypothetical protein